jgi:hypothetical protein
MAVDDIASEPRDDGPAPIDQAGMGERADRAVSASWTAPRPNMARRIATSQPAELEPDRNNVPDTQLRNRDDASRAEHCNPIGR